MSDFVDREAATVPTDEEVNREDKTHENDCSTIPEIIFYYDASCDRKLVKGIPDTPIQLHLGQSTVFGRGTENVAVFLNDQTASRNHMMLKPSFNESFCCMVYEVENISDSKKIFINGKGLTKGQKHTLKAQDTVSVGKLTFIVDIVSGEETSCYCNVSFMAQTCQRQQPTARMAQNGLGIPAVIAGVQNINIGQPLQPQPQPMNFGPGNQPMNFGPGNQPMSFGPGNQPMNFGPGNQPMNFGPGNQPMNFGPGNQPMNVGPGNQQSVSFGSPNQPMNFSPHNVPMNFGPGNQPINFGPGNQPIHFVPQNHPMNIGPQSMGGAVFQGQQVMYGGPQMQQGLMPQGMAPQFGQPLMAPLQNPNFMVSVGANVPGNGINGGISLSGVRVSQEESMNAQQRRDAFKQQGEKEPSENSEESHSTNISVEESGLPKGQSFEETNPPSSKK